jgi:hypothetical protein
MSLSGAVLLSQVNIYFNCWVEMNAYERARHGLQSSKENELTSSCSNFRKNPEIET